MKANRGTVWINAGLLLIAAALFLSAYNERESHDCLLYTSDAADEL